MKITDITFHTLRVPLVTPFKTAVREVTTTNDLIVCIHTAEGLLGYGAAPATPVITGDTLDTMHAVIATVIRPALLGKPATALNACLHALHASVQGNSSAKAAVEIALYDLWSQTLEVPLFQALGGDYQFASQPKLTTDVTISANAIDVMLKDCQRAVSNGYQVLKIKAGKDPQTDRERIEAIADAFGHKCTLRLDINQGWTAKQTISTMRSLESKGYVFELIEQPVAADDISGLARITHAIETPVMADESVFSPTQALSLLKMNAADILNIKLMKTGGISRGMQIARLAGLFHIPCMIGCMLEGSISVGAAAHFAVAFADNVTLIDLDGPTLAKFNPVTGGCVFDNANITLNASPGLGIQSVSGLEDVKPM